MVGGELDHLSQPVVEYCAYDVDGLLLALALVNLADHLHQDAHDLRQFEALLAMLAPPDEEGGLTRQLVTIEGSTS